MAKAGHGASPGEGAPMDLRKLIIISSVELCLACGIWTVAEAGAEAAIVLTQPDADFSAAPYTISFGAGAATYTFTDIYDPSSDPFTVAAVSTGGDATVNSFLGQPIAFQEGPSSARPAMAFQRFQPPQAYPTRSPRTASAWRFLSRTGSITGLSRRSALR